MAFQRLIRFLATDGRIYYGDAMLPRGVSDLNKATKARVIDGDIFAAHTVTDRVVSVEHLLAPLSQSQVGTVRCLGLNYANHAKEAGMPLPKTPVLFYKPPTSLASPNADIMVPRVAQGPGLDYEVELVIVIGKPCRDVSPKDAYNYILGYSVGDDVSHRPLQLGPGQWSLGKGFDTWAPFGPGIVSTSVIKDPQALKIVTKVNGDIKQNSSTADQIFKVAETVSLLSAGTTLMPGDVIFTGTPEGVAMGGKKGQEPWLKDGDVVEVWLENVGVCKNRVVFEGVGEAKL
ncbi:Fumarylacetoacetase-like protein [Sphaerosporella brunnea]|uniref:Fumarylacetoacetase-like protein n=1 Tax=Sphaerosporella brunnea TaxID=1250544 RepID=A0A5J5F6L9_9PEZI|nr:Fumarylacetoacetase-like protein [Sphaerosporella brunnea]